MFFKKEPQTGILYRVAFVLQHVGQVKVVATWRKDLSPVRAGQQREADTGGTACQAGAKTGGLNVGGRLLKNGKVVATT